MTAAKSVKLQVISDCEGQHIEQHFTGEWFVKGSYNYIRYSETDPNMGRTVTTIKVEPEQIRIIRQGDIQSEQTFVLHAKRIGFYQTAQGKLELDTLTHSLKVELKDFAGTFSWSYDLYVSGELTGTYYLSTTISQLKAE
jgi:uncharacterized beta-barrel protein YwiB (DUF1934 family)